MLEKERKIVIYLRKLPKREKKPFFSFCRKMQKMFSYSIFLKKFPPLCCSFVLLNVLESEAASADNERSTFLLFLSFFRVLSFYFQKLSLLNGFSVCASVAYFLVVNHT